MNDRDETLAAIKKLSTRIRERSFAVQSYSRFLLKQGGEVDKDLLAKVLRKIDREAADLTKLSLVLERVKKVSDICTVEAVIEKADKAEVAKKRKAAMEEMPPISGEGSG